jgi:hypothetical protein
MKKDQQQSVCLDSKVIELVKPRMIESSHLEDSKNVESLCHEHSGGCGLNFGVEKDDLLF